MKQKRRLNRILSLRLVALREISVVVRVASKLSNPCYFGVTILQHELAIRFGSFLAILCLLAVLERFVPRRPANEPLHGIRWLNNLALVVLNSISLRLLFPLLAIDMAAIVQSEGWGLLNLWSPPEPLAVFFGVLVLDLVIYAQHVAFHKIPLFWRLHRMHHSDVDVDASTGIRFHPIEIFLSMLIKIATVAAVGISPVAVLIFEVLLNATSLFTHANIRLPKQIDTVVRWIFVTPDMHRIHHSILRYETDSNYGFNLSLWDRMFRTYRRQPKMGHKKMTLGLPQFRERHYQKLLGLLKIPFVRYRRKE